MNPIGRAGRVRGFTLVELAIALAILGVLGALSLNQYLAYIERVRVARAVVELKDITAQLDPIAFEGGTLPSSLAAIGLGGRRDPWGRPYAYLRIRGSSLATKSKSRKDQFLVPLNTDYDLYSRGKDGLSQPKISEPVSLDDVVRANDGAFLGLAAKY
jgi:general secretion pathway protein G